MKKTIFIPFALLIVLASINVQADEATTFEVIPNSFEVEKGQEFNVSIVINPSTELDAVAADYISWNPEIVELVGKPQSGDLFEDRTIWISGKEKDETNGTLKYTAWGSTIRTEEQGTFVTLEFKAINDGLFELYLLPEDTQAAAYGEEVLTTIIGNPNEPEGQIKEKTGPIDPEIGMEVYVLALSGIIAIALISFAIYRRKNAMPNQESLHKIMNDKETDLKHNDQTKNIKTKPKKNVKIKFQKS